MRALKHLSLGLLALILTGTIAAPVARALPFSAGDLIVTTAGAALEIDPALGEVVDRLELAGVLDPCFLPNGNLLVVQEDRLLEVALSGEVVGEIELGAAAFGVALGPDGLVYVTSAAGLLRVDLATGAVETLTELVSIQNPCFLPNGNLLLAPAENPDVLLEVDPGTGGVVREIAAAGGATGLEPGPDGLVVVTTAQAGILLLDVVSGEIVERIARAGAQNPCFLPNGNLLMIDGEGALIEFDLATRTLVGQVGIPEPATGVTVVPFRFAATVAGPLGWTDGGIEQLIAEAVLSITPGSRRLVLALEEVGAVAPMFDPGNLVLPGFETGAGTAEGVRLAQGSQVSPAGTDTPMASLALRVGGRIGVRGLFIPARASGTLHLAGPRSIFMGSVRAGELLNP